MPCLTWGRREQDEPGDATCASGIWASRPVGVWACACHGRRGSLLSIETETWVPVAVAKPNRTLSCEGGYRASPACRSARIGPRGIFLESATLSSRASWFPPRITIHERKLRSPVTTQAPMARRHVIISLQAGSGKFLEAPRRRAAM